MTTQALKTTLLVLLALNVLPTLIYLVYAFDMEQFGFRLSNPDVFDMAHMFLMMAQWVVVGLSIVGIIRALKQRSAPLPDILHFPLIWYFTSSLFAWGFQLLRRPDVRPESSMPWWTWLYVLAFLAYAVACVLYFAREKTPVASSENLRWVSPWSRLGAYLLDIVLVMTFFFINLRSLAFGNSVLDDYPFFNDSPYPMISIVLFIYYFSTEAVFGRTLGKAMNGSFVVFERSRIISVLWRTLSRYIPLEAFSFIGRSEGWHDTFSRTTVRRTTPTKPRVEDAILRADQLL